ncbi:MAG TPA: coenzyme F420-reducing hydrogenase, FrhD protein [Methanothermococcus okinawensis]|uniref:Coenzyme F420-reducing hydrogenase, FrhD protein n=1 Tax=Methanothermococcus okinawensis TaxID=155863 RepID=A0A833E202_9EURY|nr:coenzyme F420-reducing hydrogenase, FrhD protein [Methanococcaceae archaeon]HIP84681.1 coenzyme F420-reducing hydrogenase, FrhD protein [Methanothermococcus okinawensis]HIP91746.1 coenzyme F420-reducing hydrogenase, FrhD protein [Methanothermococcus okinawensis]
MEDLNPSYFKEILVLGCGNILFGDDGFSFHVIEKLKQLLTEEERERVALLDAGTGAPQQVLSLIDETVKTRKIILVDTIDYKLKPGEIKILRKEDLPDPRHNSLDIHNWPLSSILKEVCERYNIELLVIGCQGKCVTKPDVYIGLSKEVEESVDKAVEIILKEIRKNSREG